MAILDFDMTNVKPPGEFVELPGGEYVMQIQGTGRKGAKDKFYENGTPHEDNGKNFYLNITMQVGSGPHQGHVESEYLNLWNTNVQTQAWARSTLKQIQDATGVHTNDSEHLHGKFLILRIAPNSKGKLVKTFLPLPPGTEVVAKQPEGSSVAPTVLQAATQPAKPAGSKPSWA